MIVTLEFPLKAISLNNYQKSTQSGRRYTTKKGKEYVQHLQHYLGKYFRELRKMSDTFCDKTHYFEVEVYHYHSNWLTKKEKKWNSKVIDADNPVKIIQDTIFDYMSIDDMYVKRSTGEKCEGDKNHITVIVKRGIRGENIISDLIVHG
jgi:Holliday junction resolvase RusA-like endonuclease